MSDDAPVVAVEFVAEVRQVKTMADHTFNWVLNVPEYCDEQTAQVLKHHGYQVKGVLEFIVIPKIESLTKLDDETTTEEAKGSGSKLDSRRLRDRRNQRTGSEV